MTANTLHAACIQLCSSRSVEDNISQTLDLISQAVDVGAEFVVTPEQTALMELERAPLFENISFEEDMDFLNDFSNLASEKNIWLQIGSLAVQISEDRAVNRSYLFSPRGEIKARYDKLHMFDVDLPGGETYRESNTYKSGDTAVVAHMDKVSLGFSICYDLRFPRLYNTLAKAGADLITVPAAFTRQTGEAHWHVLLRARAIETGCFILAAAQGGVHENGRQTFGHSLIISPWGEILAEAETDAGFIHAQLELCDVQKARQRIASLAHGRDFDLKIVP